MRPIDNAASVKQVRNAEIREKHSLERDQNDLRFVLSSPQGRRFIWKLLGACRTFESVWDNSARIHYNAGQQDVGHKIQDDVIEADMKGYLLMQQEALKEKEDNG